MTLQARASNCFSNRLVLFYHDHSVGEFKGRTFTRATEVRTTDHGRYRFEPTGVMSNRFQLVDENSETVIGAAQQTGWVGRAWQVELSHGAATLEPCGLMTSRYQLVESDEVLATTERTAFCKMDWALYDHTAGFSFADLLLLGLTYHTILLQRRRQSAAGAAGGGGG